MDTSYWPMNLPQVNTHQPAVASSPSPQGVQQMQVAQNRGVLGCSSCANGGVPQFRDISPKTWPLWAKGLTVFGVVGALAAIVVMANRR